MSKAYKVNYIRTIALFILTVLFTNAVIADTISEKELNQFGKQIESSLSSGNPYYVNLKFNTEYMLESIFSMYSLQKNTEYNAGFTEGITQNFDLGDILVKEIQQSGSFEFFCSKTNYQHPTLLFRLISESGIDYYRFDVREKDHDLILTNLYIFSTGTLLSETVATAYSKHLLSINNPKRSTSAPSDKIKSLVIDGKYKKALKEWMLLPLNLKAQKELLQLGITLSESSTVNDFQTVLQLFNEHYPNEPGKFLIPLDGLVYFEKYSEAIALVDSLDSYLGADPVLNLIRAQLYSSMGNDSEAANMYKSLMEIKPDFEIAYYSLLEFYLQKQQYQDATILLDRMINTFNSYKEAFLPLLVDHPDFLQSNIFQNWVASEL